jgi:hypothetical protein
VLRESSLRWARGLCRWDWDSCVVDGVGLWWVMAGGRIWGSGKGKEDDEMEGWRVVICVVEEPCG